MTDVLAAIDGALQDYETGGDAMRWAPPGSRPLAPAAGFVSIGGERVEISDLQVQFQGVIQAAGECMEALRPVFANLGRIVGEFTGKLYPGAARMLQVLAEAETAHRAQLSAMHREYHRRSRARRRRKR